MQRLFTLLQKRNRDRLNRLADYFEGRPPIIFGTTQTQSAFWQFQRSSRTNFAELICLAPVDKTHVRAIRTGADGDESGDPDAMSIWRYNGLESEQTQVYTWTKVFGEAYASVGLDDGEDSFTVCPEDPRQVITMQHPTKPWEAVAALKLFHDEAAKRDYAILWLPGHKYVAYQDRSTTTSKAQRFSPSGFTMAPTVATGGYDGPLTEEYEAQVVPVVRFKNRNCIGEFEHHTDLLDRINHMVLQRLVIATMQAFRQRAIELTEDLPKTDPETGQEIDYDQVFSADPGALWKLPLGAKIWESAQADLSGILDGVRSDILNLSAVTRTPLVMFTPDAATQTAEGASLQVDGLTSKVEYDCRNHDRSWALVFSIGYQFKKDAKRARLEDLQVDFMPAQRHSLSEMAAADGTSTLPFEDKLRIIYQMTPREIAAAKTNRSDDLVFQAALAAAQAPPPAPAAPANPQAPSEGGAPAAPNGQQPPPPRGGPPPNGQQQQQPPPGVTRGSQAPAAT
jgi:hypothetical protein